MVATSTLVDSRSVRLWRDAEQALRDHGLVLFLASLVFAAGNLMASFTCRELTVFSSADFVEKYVLFAGTWVLTATAVYKLARTIFIDRARQPLSAFVEWFGGHIFTMRRTANGVLGLLTFYLLMSGFTFAKNAIPGFGGFRWDADLAEVGQEINLGHRAFELLQPLVGYPAITEILDKVYLLWFPVLFTSFFLASFGGARSLHRHRFILSMILAWSIGGMLIATIFASAGPVYFDKVTGYASPYAPLFHYLSQVNAQEGLDALAVRDELWQAFVSRPSVSFISSYPSMHVTAAVLIALACWTFGGFARVASITFAILIFIGSIHLGWHYSVDSYAGILLAIAAWSAAGVLTRWYFTKLDTTPAVAAGPAMVSGTA